MNLEIKNCCFCIKLRTGSLIIGYLNLIRDLIITPWLVFNIGLAFAFGGGPDLIVPSVMTLFFFIHLIFNIVLLVGLHKCNRGLINTYLVYAIIFTIVVVITNALMAGSDPKPLIIVGLIVYLVLSIYFLVVIRSHSVKMDDVTWRPVTYNTE